MSAIAKLDLAPMSRMFKALSDETRLRIVALLSHRELCVCHVTAALDLSQPTASRQLGILRNSGVVDSRREGSWIYRLAGQDNVDCKRHLQALVRTFGKQDVVRRDVENLLKAKGPGVCR